MQAEPFPTASQAAAKKVVVELAGTVTSKPKVPSASAVVVFAGWPVHGTLTNRRTSLPASALPDSLGATLVRFGEDGARPTHCGRAGGRLSFT